MSTMTTASTPSDTSGFAGRWIMVSGASSGIGRETAVELARHGARLVLIGRDEARLAETAAALPPGTDHRLCALDLAQGERIVPAVQAIAKDVGRLYGLVHAAGLMQLLPLSALRPDRLQSLMAINVTAGLELARALVRRDILAEGGGSIVWVSSVAAHVGQPGQIGYSASKGAIKAAMRSMALELADRAVRVNAVSPGVVQTAMAEQSASAVGAEAWQRVLDMHPLGTGQPEDVARVVAFLLDPRNRWITGSDLVVDGGYTLH